MKSRSTKTTYTTTELQGFLLLCPNSIEIIIWSTHFRHQRRKNSNYDDEERYWRRSPRRGKIFAANLNTQTSASQLNSVQDKFLFFVLGITGHLLTINLFNGLVTVSQYHNTTFGFMLMSSSYIDCKIF